MGRPGHRHQPYSRYFYSVAIGKKPGIYHSWEEAKQQVEGFSSAKFKKFSTLQDAQQFLEHHSSSGSSLSKQPPVSQSMNTIQSVPNPPKTVFLLPSVFVVPSTSAASTSTCMEGPLSLDQFHHSFIPLKQLQVATLKQSDFVAFCDGSALGNGKKTAKAGWASVFPNRPEWTSSGSLQSQPTNNRAEYRAALEAIQCANQHDPSQSIPLHILSDSQLLIKSMTEWIKGWFNRHWKKSNGQPVLNSDLLCLIIRSSGKRHILWTHVPAHTGKQDWFSVYNDQADQLAKQAASY